MKIETILNINEPNEAEIQQLIEVFTKPVVQKYLSTLIAKDLAELADIPLRDMTDSEIIKAHATVSGSMSAYMTLLSIRDIKIAVKPSQQS